MPEPANPATLFVALTLSIQLVSLVTHKRWREPVYEFLRGSNLLLLFLPILLGVCIDMLYTVFVTRPPLTLRVWSFRRMLYKVLCFGCVVGSTATASAWFNIRTVAMPLCVAALFMLLCESGIMAYECRFNKVRWRGRGTTTTNTNKYEFTLEEEEELFDEG